MGGPGRPFAVARWRAGLLLIAALALTVIVGCGSDRPMEADDEAALTPAQQTLAAGCPPCEVELETRLVITDSAGQGFFDSDAPIVQRDRSGRYYAAPWQSAELLVFDSTGVQVDLIGRRGQGPGEFEWVIPPTVGLADSLLVWDAALRRTAVYSPSLEFERDYRFPFPPVFVFDDGSILVNENIPDPDHIGYPLHVLAPDGEILRSFGQDPPEFRADQAAQYSRALAVTGEGQLWTSPNARLELELWDPWTGEQLRELPTEWPEFRIDESGGREADPRRYEPSTRVTGLIHEPEGVLWVLLRHAAPDWEPTYGPDEPIPREGLSLEERERFYQWAVLAADDASGEILGEGRFPYPIRMLPGSGFFMSVARVVGEHVEVEIWEPVLVPPDGSVAEP